MLSCRREKKIGKSKLRGGAALHYLRADIPANERFFHNPPAAARRKDLLQDHNGDYIHRGDTSADGRRHLIYPRPLKQNSPELFAVRGIIICTISDLDSYLNCALQ